MMSHTEAAIGTGDTRDGRRQLAAFVAAAFGWTWGIAAVLAVLDLESAGAGGLVFAVAVFGPSVTAVALTARFEGRPGLVDLWRRVTRWQVGARWYAVVLLALPALLVLASAVRAAQTGESLLAAAPAAWPAIVLGSLMLGPLGEELGWRGFALPRLLSLMPALPAAVVLGVVWGLWHLPAFWLGVPPFDTISPVPHLVGAVLMTIIMTGIYLSTGRSVLVSGILVHTVVNASLAIVHLSMWTLVAAEAVAALAVVLVTYPVWQARRPAVPAAPARASVR